MSASLRRRTKRVAAPFQPQQMVAFIEGPMDMSLETAQEILNFDGANHSAVFYYGIRKLGERPRYMGGPEVVSDEEWEKHKNYPRVRGWWNDDQGDLDQYPGLADRAAASQPEASSPEETPPGNTRPHDTPPGDIRPGDHPVPENTATVATGDSRRCGDDEDRREARERAWKELDDHFR